jgi:tripartite-type tricarboxylate transporter receptor subunit TctC
MRATSCSSAMLIAIGLTAAAIAPPAQSQQKFPAKPIRLVVPFSAGGVPDTLARIVGPKMSDQWGQPVVVENRVGAGGAIGTAMVAKAEPDGHTLLLTSSAFAVSAALHSRLPYHPLKDFSGVSDLGFSNMVLVAAPALGVRSMGALIARAQAEPGKMLFGSAGAGSATHMHGERFRLAAGIKATHVGFKGQPEFLIEIMAGRVHYGVASLVVALPLIEDGRLVPLAVTQRMPALPQVPSASEALPGWTRDGGLSLRAPAGTPRPVLQRISKEVSRILHPPEVRERLNAMGFHVKTSTPEESDMNMRRDIEMLSKVVKAAGLRVE